MGDVTVPEHCTMATKLQCSHSADVPKPCGSALRDMSCLGLKFGMTKDASGQVFRPPPPFERSSADDKVATGVFRHGNFLMTAQHTPQRQYQLACPVNAAMLGGGGHRKPQPTRRGGGAGRSARPQRDTGACYATARQVPNAPQCDTTTGDEKLDALNTSSQDVREL